MRATLLVMIPVNLVLAVWVWIGRIVFGVGGWFFLILFPVAVVLVLALAVTTVLAYTQAGRPRSLTPAQTGAQLATWVGMLGFGAFIPDFGDTEDSYNSLLSVVFGRSDGINDVSMTIALSFGLLTVVAYLVLLVLLIARRRSPQVVGTGGPVGPSAVP